MNNLVSNQISTDIQALYKENQAVAALLDVLATKKRKRDFISVKYACQLTDFDYDDMEKALRDLHDIKVGKFIRAHGDNPARLNWWFHPKSLAEAATGSGQPETLGVLGVDGTDEGENDDEVPADSVRHNYLLRPGCQVAITLPLDLTRREAERLSQFIQSLPLEAD